MSEIIRTVLGDIAPQDLGCCYAHEHIIIDASVATLRYPDFQLHSVGNGVAELSQFYADGGRAMVDSMPCDAGRNVLKLAQISQQSKVHILCPTGLHLAKYYDDGHWSHHYSAEQMAELFIADITQGIDRYDYSGPCVDRSLAGHGLLSGHDARHPCVPDPVDRGGRCQPRLSLSEPAETFLLARGPEHVDPRAVLCLRLALHKTLRVEPGALPPRAMRQIQAL